MSNNVPMDLLVFDGDQLAFVASAANESRSVICKCSSTGQELTFSTRTLLKKWLSSNEEAPPYAEWTFQDQQEPNNPHFAYKMIRDMIERSCKACQCDNFIVVISGEDNFRLDIPLPQRYKSNRKNSIRPVQLKQCKQYLIDKYNAETSVGCEADDVLATYCFQGYKNKQRVCQVTFDKDADSNISWQQKLNTDNPPIYIPPTIGELHINSAGKVKGTGRKWFWNQTLVGDSCDMFNPRLFLKNPPRFGEKSSFKLLDPCKTDKELMQIVYNQYLEWFPSPFKYTAWDGKEYETDAVGVLQMIVDCCHMRRWPEDRVDIRSVLCKNGIIT